VHDEPDADLVRCLLREQFPQLAAEPVVAVKPGGWDNRTFRVGERLSARLPSADRYVPAVEKEHRWLPFLAERLPVLIPAPIARGRPGCGFPRPWSLYGWLPGASARAQNIDDMRVFTRDLVQFLAALQTIEAAGGPVAGEHSFGRGGPLALYDGETRAAVRALSAVVDERAVIDVWDAALARPYFGEPVWVHGDMTASNLLVEHGRLAAVIDFGTCAVGDPSCDLVIAWTFLEGDARQQFRRALPADAAMWARARGWALWKALLTLADQPTEAATVRRYGWRLHARELIETLIDEHRGLR
jgi:aminoglycoside phosphotransferase (APT) family kinase protein